VPLLFVLCVEDALILGFDWTVLRTDEIFAKMAAPAESSDAAACIRAFSISRSSNS
jgi:hypothetical protein